MQPAASARLVWSGTGRAAPWVFVVFGLILAVLVVVGVVFLFTPYPAGFLFLLLMAAFLAAVAAMTGGVRVDMDDHGIRWRTPLNFPRGAIPWEEVRNVEVERLRPRDWNGTGYRHNNHGTAVILFDGDGLKISRRGKPPVYLSVGDAARGAEVARRCL